MRRAGLSLLVMLIGTGCIADTLVPCGTMLCPASLVCTLGGCATPEAAAACADQLDHAPCTTTMTDRGACGGGACHPITCGDNLVDPGEVCDDGNTIAGDDCSATCESVETCGNGVVDLINSEECDSGLAGLSGDGCASSCKIEIVTWGDETIGPIPPRSAFASAWDPVRERWVVFGGIGATATLGDTWEASIGGDWSQALPIRSPPKRSRAAMTFHTASGRTILFGGLGAAGTLGDMWQWDGFTWTELHPPVMPSPRSECSLVYDSVRGRAVLFGGVDPSNGFLADTWEWDGTSWTRIQSATSPPATAAYGLAYDVARGVTVLFGGLRASTPSDETWEYNGITWTLRAPKTSRPPPTYFAAMTYDVTNSRVVLFGGYTPALSGETWAWDGTDWTRLAAGPTPRTDAALVHASLMNQSLSVTILFGGNEGSRLTNDWWILSAAGWDNLAAAPLIPDARSYSAMTYDSMRGHLVMFGGWAADNSALGDTWFGTERGWSQPSVDSARPDSRILSALAYVASRERSVLFGGLDDLGRHRDDTWELDIEAWQSVDPPNRPSGRSAHSMAYDAARDRVVLFGGKDATNQFDDTWEWDGVTWTEHTTSVRPPRRSGAALAYDPIRERVVLFGGYSTPAFLGDTWEWDGTGWTDVTPAVSPAPRNAHGMTYDAHRRRIVLFGGVALGSFGDTWEWDGMQWTAISPKQEARSRYGQAVTYDPVRRRVIAFGGDSLAAPRAADVWTLRYESLQPIERCLTSSDDDDLDGLAGCADPDCWGRCTPRCPPGATCSPALPRCGDSTCSSIEDDKICPADC